MVGSGGFDEIIASTYTGSYAYDNFIVILIAYLDIGKTKNYFLIYDPIHLGWVFGLTTENAENASRLRAESVSSMSSFASSESSSTRDKLNKLRYLL